MSSHHIANDEGSTVWMLLHLALTFDIYWCTVVRSCVSFLDHPLVHLFHPSITHSFPQTLIHCLSPSQPQFTIHETQNPKPKTQSAENQKAFHRGGPTIRRILLLRRRRTHKLPNQLHNPTSRLPPLYLRGRQTTPSHGRRGQTNAHGRFRR